MAKSRATQCVRLAKLVERGQQPSVKELATQLGVSRRSIYRYRQVLKAAAIDAAGPMGMRINGNGKSRSCQPIFSEREAVALVMAVQTSPVKSVDEYREAVPTALAKLLAAISPETREKTAGCIEHTGRGAAAKNA